MNIFLVAIIGFGSPMPTAENIYQMPMPAFAEVSECQQFVADHLSELRDFLVVELKGAPHKLYCASNEGLMRVRKEKEA